MATTIVPARGAAPLFTTSGTGAAPGYSAIDDRRQFGSSIQAGVFGASDYKVAQRGAGANMSVDIGMPSGGAAVVTGTAVVGQGQYYVPVHSTTVNEVIASAHLTLPRIDSVFLHVYDNTEDSSGLNVAKIEVVTGTATSGATLDNRNGGPGGSGGPAVPLSSLLLGDVLVPAGSSSVVTANLRDRRSWARGAFNSIIRNTANYATTSTSLVAMDSTNLNPRIECTGVPIMITFNFMYTSSGAASYGFLRPSIDGGVIDGGALKGLLWVDSVAAESNGSTMQWITTPTAGSHLFAPYYATEAAKTFTIYAGAAAPFQMVVEEIVRQNTNNS